MPLINYKPHNFAPTTRHLIRRVNDIIDHFQAQGFTLTLRQLYYQLVSHNHIPNTTQAYKRLSATITDARNAGLIDWEAIEDRTRQLSRNPHWDNPQDMLHACAHQFRTDRWAHQTHRVEVWIEKDALFGVFWPTCEALDVPLLACRGYTSSPRIWADANRLRHYLDAGQTPIVLHFADHDPSGIDMTRDLAQRLNLYAGQHINVTRLALTHHQATHHKLPPQPAKRSDSRFHTYRTTHGTASYELDALDPSLIAALIRTHVGRYLDAKAWEASNRRDAKARKRLAHLADTWPN